MFWSEHDGRRVEVAQYRCVYCGAADLIRRDWNKRHENDEPVMGKALAADGRMFVPRPVTEKPTDEPNAAEVLDD